MANDNESAKQPKYRAADFMQKEIALFHRTRAAMRAVRRFGDDDAPIRPVTSIAAVRSVRPVPEPGRIDLDA